MSQRLNGQSKYHSTPKLYLKKVGLLRQFWSFQAMLTDFHETIVSSNLDQIAWTKDLLPSIFWPLSSGVHEFATKNLLTYLCSAYRDNIYDISLFGKFLPSNSELDKSNLYIYNFFGVISADLSEIKLSQCVSILLTGTGTCFKSGERRGSMSKGSLRVCGGGKTLSCHFTWFKIISLSYENSLSKISQTSGSDAELKKESILLHSGSGQHFWGKISHFINFEKLAYGNQSIGS